MSVAERQEPTIAIVGGGFTGAAIAFHLAVAGARARILLFEPRALLGAGLAYGGSDPTHRINVPATRMSLIPGDDAHFARWLESSGELAADPGALVGGDAYATRQAFGRYVDAALRPHVAAKRVVHIADKIVSAEKTNPGWALRTARGEAFTADLLVLATTHPAPGVPGPFAAFRDDPRLIADGLADGALDAIQPDDRVLIVGAGLTGADVVCALDSRGHKGPITMISRRGLRPKRQAETAYPPEGDFYSHPARGAAQLVGDIRRAIRKAVAQGRTWHPVIDAVRAQGGLIWGALDAQAQRRIVRHLRPYWDVHRFRAAPQVDAIIDRKIAEGSLDLRKAHLGAVKRRPDGFVVGLRQRRDAAATTQTFGRIVVATGPAHRDIVHAQPYLGALWETGLIAPDSAGLGLRTSRSGRAIGASGEAEPSLFIAGPLARGTFGELMGLPQVSTYARFIAEELLRVLSDSPDGEFSFFVPPEKAQA
jgi:uncharacterized NAD(P)/FAD-binding protein YdhS